MRRGRILDHQQSAARVRAAEEGDALKYCAFCSLVFVIDDMEIANPPPVFRDANGVPRRACWSCCSAALRLVHEEGRIHGQLALVTAEDVRSKPMARLWPEATS